MEMTSSQSRVGRTLLCAAFELDCYGCLDNGNQDPKTKARSKATSKAADKSVRPTRLVVVYALCETVDFPRALSSAVRAVDS